MTEAFSRPELKPTERRLLPPADNRAVVYFPVVSSAGASLASLECVRWQQATGRRFMLSHPKFGHEVEQILADARFDETPAQNDSCVRIRFAPSDFSGRSYGLALALADKLARFGLVGSISGKRLYATGNVLADGQGAIGGVSRFAEKVELIERLAPSGSLFVFPRLNYENADGELRRRLSRLQASQGVACRHIDHIDDLQDMFLHRDNANSRRLPFGLMAAVGFSAVAAIAAASWFYTEPAATPESTNSFPYSVSYFYRPGGLGTLQSLQPGTELRSGDHYGLRFDAGNESDQRYAYILQQDGSRKIHCLFPDPADQRQESANRNPIRAGSTYHVPGEDEAFELDQSEGLETIHFLVFTELNERLEQHCSDRSVLLESVSLEKQPGLHSQSALSFEHRP